MAATKVAIIGPGRVGLTLARALVRCGHSVVVLGRHAELLPDPLEPVCLMWPPALADADVVIVAVPDDALAEVAMTLAKSGVIAERHVVLHTSGLYDRTMFAALYSTRAALGSLHLLQTFAVADGEPDVVCGAPAFIEGDARALDTARRIAGDLECTPVVEIDGEQKAAYHAAAVFASNYLAVLADVATRLTHPVAAAGASVDLFIPIMRRVLENIARLGPALALTGPVARGDAGTVERHLEALEGTDRELYIVLAREALKLARRGGLDEKAAGKVEGVIG